MKTTSCLSAMLLVAAGSLVACKEPAKAGQPLVIPTYHLGQLAPLAGKTDKGPSGHNYVEVYEKYLFQWKYDPIRILEIGVEAGGSLDMWELYFPNATIYGIDIVDKSAMNRPRVKTLIADQSKRDQLQNALGAAGGKFDLVVDDGGHTMEQQQVSLGYLFKFVKPGGYYILEDIHTSLPAIYPNYGVEPDGGNTTLRVIENYMHSVPPVFVSKYMLPDETAHLNANVEYANLVFRNNPAHSITCIFKKR